MSEPAAPDRRRDPFIPGRFVHRYPLLLLILFTGATLLLSLRLGAIRVAEDPLRSLYPEGHPFLPALQAIEEMAPVPRMLIAILHVEEGDIFNTETLRKIDGLTRGLTRIEGVLPGRITSLTLGIDHYDNTAGGMTMGPILGRTWPETPEDFEALRRRVAVSPMGPGRYVAYDGSAAMITAPLADTVDLEPLETGVRALAAGIADARHDVLFTGPQLIEAQMTRMGRRQIPLTAAVSVILIMVLLAVRFRTWHGGAVPLLVMTLSLLWCLGLLAAAGVELNPMALAFPFMLGLFALAHTVLFMDACSDALDETGERGAAIRTAFRRAPVVASILTAGLAAASLAWTGGAPVLRDLGRLGGLWLVSTLVVAVLAVPSLLRLLPASTPVRRSPSGTSSGGRADLRSGRWRRPALVLLLLLLGAGGFAGSRLDVGDNIPGSSYLRPSHPWNRGFHLMSEKFLGPFQLLAHARASAEGGMLDPDAMGALGDFSGYLESEAGARESIAFDMMIKLARDTLMDGNPKWRTVPVSGEQVRGLAGLVVEQGGEVKSFMDGTFTEATVSPFFPGHEAGEVDAYAAAMQAYIDRHPSDQVRFRLGGGLLGMTKVINDGTREAYRRSLALAFVLVFVLGVVATRSVVRGAAVVLPLAAAQAAVWLVMAAAGMKLNMPVVLVSAPALGFGAIFALGLVRGRDGIVPFLGLLTFAAALPWFFVGLRFTAQMMLVFGLTSALAAACSILFVPALIGRSVGTGRDRSTSG